MKNAFKILIVVALFSFANITYATENVLNSVNVSNNTNGYKLILNAEKSTEYKKKTESSSKIYFEINNVVQAPDISTVYNAKGVESVVIQQVSKDKTRIYVNGINADKTELLFDVAGNIVKPEPKADFTFFTEDFLHKTDFVFFGCFGLILLSFFAVSKSQTKTKFAPYEVMNNLVLDLKQDDISLGAKKVRKILKAQENMKQESAKFQTREKASVPVDLKKRRTIKELEVLKRSA